MRSVEKGGFDWRRYTIARLTRLWVVLLPALLLTLACDFIGTRFAPDAYSGGWYEIWLSGPSTGKPFDDGILTFIGNSLFLQTIMIPVFGTNGPLWSLAYEFWYYVMFPLVVLSISMARRREARGALFCFLVLVILLFWLPLDLLKGGVIWMAGVSVAMITTRYGRPNLRPMFAAGLVIVASLPLIAALVASKFMDKAVTDCLVGGAFALLMLALPSRLTTMRFLEPFGEFLASISYTLYVMHFPILFFLGAVMMDGRQFHALEEGLLTYGLFLFAALLVATLFWWCLERRTERVRLAVGNWLDSKR